MKVLLAHPGTQHSFQLAKQLNKQQILYQFWTSFAVSEHCRLKKFSKYLPHTLNKAISNRVISHLPACKIKTYPFLELQMLYSGRKGMTEKLIHVRNLKFQKQIPDEAIKSADVIIGFDTSSWILAERAHHFGKKFILDQSIAHPLSKHKVYSQLNHLYPEWSENLLNKSKESLACEKLEHKLADLIVTASTFTKNTLIENHVDENKIVINPYGVDTEVFEHNKSSQKALSPTRFLYLGTQCARKGLPTLLKVWERLNDMNAELWLIGPSSKDVDRLIPSTPSIKNFGKISHNKISDYIKQCDVLVFPSFFEGFGLVILEALASGLPVITTDATAGPDIITNGKEGFLYTAIDIEQLFRNMHKIAIDPSLLKDMKVHAINTSKEYSWDEYGNRYQKIIQSLYENP